MKLFHLLHLLSSKHATLRRHLGGHYGYYVPYGAPSILPPGPIERRCMGQSLPSSEGDHLEMLYLLPAATSEQKALTCFHYFQMAFVGEDGRWNPHQTHSLPCPHSPNTTSTSFLAEKPPTGKGVDSEGQKRPRSWGVGRERAVTGCVPMTAGRQSDRRYSKAAVTFHRATALTWQVP